MLLTEKRTQKISRYSIYTVTHSDMNTPLFEDYFMVLKKKKWFGD